MTLKFIIPSALAASMIIFYSPLKAQSVKALYSFPGTNSSGNPGLGSLVQGRNGYLYGTSIGPSGSNGSVFAATTTGKVSQPFTFGSDGVMPYAGLTLGTDGYYYGTTTYGGSTDNGVLYKLSPTGIYTVLHDFQGGADGANPYSPPIQASDSSFYGTTFGANFASTVYRYDPKGTFTTIYNFDDANGQGIYAPLIQSSDGNLYGTAAFGGIGGSPLRGCGTIFKLTMAGQPLWAYAFPCGIGGAAPVAPLLQASDGNFYGTAGSGGNTSNCGTIFKLDGSGNVTTIHVLSLIEGYNPVAGLTQGVDGNLYGTTYGAGRYGAGTLFQVSTNGEFHVLYNFDSSGSHPEASPMEDTNGIFYGTTYAGGRYGYGSVFSLNMGLGPFIAFVQPTGEAGANAQILGQGFTGTTAVTFNGVPATSFQVVSDTYMTAVVPTNATTGPVVVTTPTGPLTSNVNFRITK